MVFGKIPKSGVDLRADPGELRAVFINSEERTVMVNGIELILFFRVIPSTRIDDNLFAVRYAFRIRHTDLVCGIGDEVIIIEIGFDRQVHPVVGIFGGCRGAEAVGCRVFMHSDHGAVGTDQLELTAVGTGAGNDRDVAGRCVVFLRQ